MTNFNREELYNLIWSKPLSVAIAACDISLPVFRQICLTHKIPLPWSGYKPGKERSELPTGEYFELPAAIAEAVNSLHFQGETTATFKIPRKLSEPDPMVVAASDTVKHDYQFHGMSHMVRAGNGQLAIRASKSNFDRALRIMDTLIRIWRNRGYRIVNQDKETTVYLREVSIHVSIRETTTVEPPKEKYGSQIHTATGQLAFKIKGWLDREWKDGKVPMETHLKEICDHMEVAARELEGLWAERKQQQQKEKQEQQALALRLQQDTEESAAFEVLVQEAQRWNELNVLDQYLDFLRHNIPHSPAFEKWLQWAHRRRRVFDPVEKRKTTLL